MSYLLKRWWQPALLLFFLFVISACREIPAEVLDTPSPESPTPAEDMEARPSPVKTVASTSTALPTVNYNGIQFAFDESTLGPLGANAHHPPVPPGAGFVQPEHLEIQLRVGDQNSAPTLYIFPVQQYEALSEEAAREIAHLRNLLAERPQEIAGNLPFLPMVGAIQNYHSNPKYIDFKNGSGISFLTNVDHDHSLITDQSLFYTFQGLTNDNRFYVAALVPISNMDTEEPTNTADASPSGEASDHNAKAAVSHGNWISVDLGDGRTLIDDIMHSLDVQPDENFPSIKLPRLFTSQGLLIAFDEAISGPASVEYNPALIEDPEGEIAFLPGVPDMVTVQFQSKAANSADAELQIQAVRDDQGQFFEGIPEWLQQKTIALEQDDLGLIHLRDEGTVTKLTRISFQNGSGFRGITTLANDETDDNGAKEVYLFKGASEDGRYLVELRHPLPESLSHENAVFYLDNMVNSLLVAPNTSSGSSMPVNSADCENEAVFVEDVSIPDYTVVERGDQFVKIWRIRNTGSCTWSPTYQVAFSQGNPVEWHGMAVAEIVSPGEETEVSVTVQSPEVPGIYQAWWQLSNEQGEIFGDQLGLLFEAPKAATDIPGYGVIEGEINYPANGNPAVDIYFLNVETGDRFAMRTEQGWTHYANAVPVGTYYVFSRVAGDTSDSGGGYTQAVICGLHSACTDHNLVDVIVEEGRASREINLYDWYAPAGSFPLPPPSTQEAGN